MAEAIGLSIYEYGDLEAYDDEIINVVSFEAAKNVAAFFGLSLLQLLVPENELWPVGYLGPTELTKLVSEKMNKEGLSLEETENRAGWYLEGFFADPESYVAENPITFLVDLAGFLGVDWLSTIPRSGGG